MEKISYFFAAVYQSIKSRRPDGTPYANLILGTTGILLLDIFNSMLVLEIWFHVHIISHSKILFAFYFIFLAAMIFMLIKTLIPIDQIREVEVTQRDVKMLNFFFFFLVC